MSLVSCNICLGSLNLKDETVHSTSCGHVFHHPCLLQALKTSTNCPQCRHPGIKHFQLFFTVENDEPGDEAGACHSDSSSLSQKMSDISRKLDRLNTQLSSSSGGKVICDREVEMYRDLVHQLQRENQDLKEILQMEKILSTNTEKELDQMKLEIHERNDLINVLQLQNDTLREENLLYETRPTMSVDNLLDL